MSKRSHFHLFCRRLLQSVCIAACGSLLATSLVYAQDAESYLTQAKAYEQAADYRNAAASYREYLLQKAPKSAARRHARLKLPVLQEAATHGADPALQLYLSALDFRAEGDAQQAVDLLAEINSYSGSSLSDDALYLRAYIALMDFYEFDRALTLLQSLRDAYPQSKYIDTAMFAKAIIEEQLGNGDAAMTTMRELRDRHTGISVGGINWAKDEYVSRLWFERSSKRIDYLLDRAENATRLVSFSEYGSEGYQWQVELIVEKENFTLLLNESTAVNNVVITGDDPSVDNYKVNAFSGIVQGQTDSWTRITIDDLSVRGMISVNGKHIQLVPITTGGSLSDFHTLLLGDIDGNVSEEQDRALLPPKEDVLDNYLRNIKQATTTELTPGTASQVAMVGVVIDSNYIAYHGDWKSAVNESLSILNSADGIFREQMGIAIKAKSVVLFNNRNADPMNLGSVTMEAMLLNFKDYRMSSQDLGSDIGFATLFSGNKNSDTALGLAWIGAACRTDGHDVSVVTPYKDPSLLSTHEIGHSMGAAHDKDTACSTQQTHIMWPYLSSNSGRTFSSCSRQSITATMMTNNSCYLDAIDLSLTLDNIDSKSIQITVSNEESQRSTPYGLITLTGPGLASAASSHNCNSTGADTLQCSVGALAPMESKEYRFNFSTELSGTAQLLAWVDGDGNSFVDPTTTNNGFGTDIYGSLSSYAPDSDQPTITFREIEGTIPKANDAGGGSLRPNTVIVLSILLLSGGYRARRAKSFTN